jgi:hypothetical protein
MKNRLQLYGDVMAINYNNYAEKSEDKKKSF